MKREALINGGEWVSVFVPVCMHYVYIPCLFISLAMHFGVDLRCTHCYDVNKIIFSQCIQDCFDGVFGYGHPESLHTATDINHDHYIFW